MKSPATQIALKLEERGIEFLYLNRPITLAEQHNFTFRADKFTKGSLFSKTEPNLTLLIPRENNHAVSPGAVTWRVKIKDEIFTGSDIFILGGVVEGVRTFNNGFTPSVDIIRPNPHILDLALYITPLHNQIKKVF